MTLSVADSGANQANSITTAVSANVGDLMLVAVCSPSVPTVSGSVQGAYAPILNTSGFDTDSIFAVVCTGTGTETITVSPANGNNRIAFIRVTGFAGTATVIPADSSAANAGGSPNAALNSGSFLTSVSNEYAFGYADTIGQGFSAQPSGWTNETSFGGFAETYFQGPNASVGTSVNLSGTLHGSTGWGALIVGFYDNVARYYSLSSNEYF